MRRRRNIHDPVFQAVLSRARSTGTTNREELLALLDSGIEYQSEDEYRRAERIKTLNWLLARDRDENGERNFVVRKKGKFDEDAKCIYIPKCVNITELQRARNKKASDIDGAQKNLRKIERRIAVLEGQLFMSFMEQEKTASPLQQEDSVKSSSALN